MADLAQVIAAGTKAGAEGDNQFIKGTQQAQQTAQQGQNEQALAKLKNYLEGQTSDSNIEKANDMLTSGNLPEGSGVNISGTGGVGVTRGWNPMTMQQNSAHQAQNFLKTAQGAYKGINDQADAAQSTLDLLNQKNANSDKLAVINELKSQGVTRGIATMFDTMSGGKTIGGTAQDYINYIQNTPNVPAMQDAQRDAMRESVFTRAGLLGKQREQAAQQLTQQGPVVAPQADTSTIVSSFDNPVNQKLQSLQKAQQDYMSQRQKMQQQGNSPISNPSTADANPSTFEKLKSFFNPNPSPPPQAPAAPQAQQQSNSGLGFTSDDIATALAKKGQQAVGNPNKPLTPPQQPQQGQ